MDLDVQLAADHPGPRPSAIPMPICTSSSGRVIERHKAHQGVHHMAFSARTPQQIVDVVHPFGDVVRSTPFSSVFNRHSAAIYQPSKFGHCTY